MELCRKINVSAFANSKPLAIHTTVENDFSAGFAEGYVGFKASTDYTTTFYSGFASDDDSLILRANFDTDCYFDRRLNDFIKIYVSGIESASTWTSEVDVPHYKLAPCESLKITFELERYMLMNRANSPCSNGFPTNLKHFIKKAEEFHVFEIVMRSTFGAAVSKWENQPYDKHTCENLCLCNYWFQTCGCFESAEIRKTPVSPDDISRCQEFFPSLNYSDPNSDCSVLNYMEVLPGILDKCECFDQCNSYKFKVTNSYRQTYSMGKAIFHDTHLSCCFTVSLFQDLRFVRVLITIKLKLWYRIINLRIAK